MDATAQKWSISQNKTEQILKTPDRIEIELLRGKDADLTVKDAFNSTPLHKLGSTGNYDLAQGLLLDIKDTTKLSLIDAKDEDGFTPLMCAALTGNIKVARLFIQNGADPNSVNKKEETPMMLAAAWGHTELCIELHRHGALLDPKDAQGHDAIDIALQNQRTETYEVLCRIQSEIEHLVIQETLRCEPPPLLKSSAENAPDSK